MKALALAAALVASAMTSACVTQYGDMGSQGGVQAVRITSNTFQVTARGNGLTDPDTIVRFALRKAAEVTLENGFDYFTVGDQSDRTQGIGYGYGAASYNRGRASAFSLTGMVIKPGRTIMVHTFKGAVPDPAPPGVYNAREVAANLSMGNYLPKAPK